MKTNKMKATNKMMLKIKIQAIHLVKFVIQYGSIHCWIDSLFLYKHI